LGRVINLERAGKERNRLARLVLTAIRLLGQQEGINERTRDLAAFVCLALGDLYATVDPTVEAWEKRGYWVKADRYRMEWMWADTLGKKMRTALLEDDWGVVAMTSAEIAGRLAKVEPLKKLAGEEPWKGSWKKLKVGEQVG
jgi:hypothetical protein